MKCPNCNAQIIFNDENDYAFCSHCGTQVFKENVKINKNININRTIDDAEVKRVEAEIKQDEMVMKHLPLILLFIFAMCALLILPIFFL